MREPDGWIDLSDFKAGIVHDLGQASVGGSPTGRAAGPDGSASIENTYRCITLAGGGLGPLPQQDWTYSRPSFAVGTAVVWTAQMFITGPVSNTVIGGISYDDVDPRDTSTIHKIDVLLAFDGVRNDTGARLYKLVRDRAFEASPTITSSDTIVSATSGGGSPLQIARAGTYMTDHYMTFGSIRNHVVLATYNPSSNVASSNVMFPDPTSAVTAITAVPLGMFIGAGGAGGRVVSHQGRYVIFPGGTFGNAEFDGPGTTTNPRRFTNDPFVFTTPGTNTQDGSTASIVTQDSDSGIGVAASISASDLLLITHTYGAALVQGDLANPTVRRMPAVVGTGGACTVGVSTPAGYVYAVNRGGVYAWTGETSTLLSPALPDDFWFPATGTTIPSDYHGRFALWQNWVLCPNNWLYDLATTSWWRLEDPVATGWVAYEWMVNPYNGYVYGNAPTWVDGGVTNMSGRLLGFNRAKAALSWSWQSQPLYRTRNRIVEVREVELVAQGTGTIAVTLTAIDGTTQTQTATVSSASTSQQLRLTFSVQGADVQVRFVATGGIAAPVLYNARIGYNERMHTGAG